MKSRTKKTLLIEHHEHGLKLTPVIEENAHVLGGPGNLGGEVLQPDGNWEAYLPTNEYQNLNGVEPYACTCFGTFNAIETLIKCQYGETRNYSDRLLAVLTGTASLKGNNPHTIAEFLRKEGAVKEELWPFSTDITTFEKYYATPPKNLLGLAKEFVAEWAFGHEYVLPNPQQMKDALQYSPLGISVYAWAKDTKTDIYYRPEGYPETHWCMVYDYEEGKYWKVFDSYDQSHKKYDWNAKISTVKRYKIDRQVKHPNLFQQFISFLVKIFPLPAPPGIPEAPIIPTPTPMTFPTPNAEKLYNAAYASLGMDMDNTVPDEVACAASLNAVFKKAFGKPIGGFASTAEMYKVLKRDARFEQVSEYEPGAIIMSPTGTSTKKAPNGHVGVCGKTNIMSNNSYTGKWGQDYNLEKWTKYYAVDRGFPVIFYRVR